ncbi:MAG: CheY-like chemotaxis protein [Flavobacteriales bacterium]|jgi:CheY-like chemotaxis protein
MKYNYKILIIDDNIIDQIVTKQLLKKKLNLTETYAVSSGKDGIVWLENFIKGAEDKLIILLDIKMPEMDGFAFLEEFEKLDKKNSSQIMIVMLSSTLDPNDKKRAKNNVYVKTLLNKPLPTEEFSSLLVE